MFLIFGRSTPFNGRVGLYALALFTSFHFVKRSSNNATIPNAKVTLNLSV